MWGGGEISSRSQEFSEEGTVWKFCAELLEYPVKLHPPVNPK
jgi:hypothetical protein